MFSKMLKYTVTANIDIQVFPAFKTNQPYIVPHLHEQGTHDHCIRNKWL